MVQKQGMMGPFISVVIAAQKFRFTGRSIPGSAGPFLTFTLIFQEWLGREAQEVLSGSTM